MIPDIQDHFLIRLKTLEDFISQNYHVDFHNFGKRLKKLEDYIGMEEKITNSDVLNRLKIIENRSEIHETNLKRKWDANSELSKRLTELEECTRKDQDAIYQRLDKLEIMYESFLKTQHPRLLKERIDYLDKENKTLIKMVMDMNDKVFNVKNGVPRELSDIECNIIKRLCELEKNNFNKSPYKCPVCDGCGNSKGTIESNPNFDFHSKYAHCHSCEGKGIVWC